MNSTNDNKSIELVLLNEIHIIQEELGKGTFAYVFKCTNTKTKKAYALKIFQRGFTTVETECKALSHCGYHPNIIQFYTTSVITSKCNNYNGTKELPVLLFEQAVNGDIFQIVRNSRAGLPENVCLTYFHQLLNALKHLHLRGIYHRDVKVENLLLDSNFNLKLTDFGLASIPEADEPASNEIFSLLPFPFREDKKEKLIAGDVGTTPYAAPEIFSETLYLGSAVDVWSSGCSLFVMLLACPPFVKPVKNACQLFEYIAKKEYTKFWSVHDDKNVLSSGVKGLLEKIFQVDFQNRITLKKIFQDDWMKGKILTSIELKCTMLNITSSISAKKKRVRD